jgi:hypothetical protein
MKQHQEVKKSIKDFLRSHSQLVNEKRLI